MGELCMVNGTTEYDKWGNGEYDNGEWDNGVWWRGQLGIANGTKGVWWRGQWGIKRVVSSTNIENLCLLIKQMKYVSVQI